jgi:hypothetical protein
MGKVVHALYAALLKRAPESVGSIAGAQALRQVMVRTIGYIIANATALHCGSQAPHRRKKPRLGENQGFRLVIGRDGTADHRPSGFRRVVQLGALVGHIVFQSVTCRGFYPTL